MFERLKKYFGLKDEVKEISIREALIKSRTVICGYLTIGITIFKEYGQDIISQLTTYLPQMREFLNPQFFGAITILTTLGTIYFYIISNKVVKKGKEDDKSNSN